MAPPYFDSVRNPSTFKHKVSTEEPGIFSEIRLHDGGNISPSAVSNWGREHLLALRVLCVPFRPFLSVLEGHSRHRMSLGHHLQRLIAGPEHGVSELAQMSELEIEQHYEGNGLGVVWAAQPDDENDMDEDMNEEIDDAM
ncbi:hypothetical protein C8A05DRAFT_38107 [Staphylotrichum tortipilum]|uniref:Uncharacterized protein n=1 Tax=Staphylotrichum tortipilum TaxID=2831512 RepID=A0AAN6MCD8_9PEZI|nr:hypothetical protein C8A05DRAFT_38107 [Staphylotrichum longicolle]